MPTFTADAAVKAAIQGLILANAVVSAEAQDGFTADAYLLVLGASEDVATIPASIVTVTSVPASIVVTKTLEVGL